MVLLVNIGLLFAPAAHGGALFPGVMPFDGALELSRCGRSTKDLIETLVKND
jgi:hypothetical protein